MFATAFFEITENAAIELEDLSEACTLQEWRRFLTTNAARAKGHDWFVFEMTGQRGYCHWKFTEMGEVKGARAAERAEFFFVGVGDIEKGDGTALVEPFLQRFGRPPWGWTTTGVYSRKTERDYFFFDLRSEERR